ncbi:hypothetical protein SAMN03159423_5145 [Bradyrhizobium sp. NFR13]|jgi:hypothetical protein|nr:hypothetical protein SAMN05216367_1691 [Tardiphaga sp. OK245]SFM05892.1 hypothetical protein SAMN03159423_5145 [Bradyrhizobium sp. NFR13]
MTPSDYARMAKNCAERADALEPGPKRDELLKKAQQFRFYAKVENWVASPGLQPPD